MKNPAVISMDSHSVGIIVSLLLPETASEARFEDENLRSHVGGGKSDHI